MVTGDNQVEWYGLGETIQSILKYKYKSLKVVVGDRSRGWPEGSLFDSNYTKV